MFHVGGIAALTLLVNATTAAPLLRYLGLARRLDRMPSPPNVKWELPTSNRFLLYKRLEDIPTTIFFLCKNHIVISSPCFMFHSLIFWRNLRNFHSSQEFRGRSTETTGADQTLGSTHAGDQGASPFLGGEDFFGDVHQLDW